MITIALVATWYMWWTGVEDNVDGMRSGPANVANTGLPSLSPGSSSNHTGGDRAGCTTAQINPFVFNADTNCKGVAGTNGFPGAPRSYEVQSIALLERIREGTLKGEPESASDVLSFGQACKVQFLATSSPEQRVPCEVALGTQAAALKVLETAAAAGDPDAQFYLCNWLTIVDGDAFEAAMANNNATVRSDAARAEKLFAQAIAGGSVKAKEFMKTRDSMLASMKSGSAGQLPGVQPRAANESPTNPVVSQ